MDEASIALNLLNRDPFELFGALEFNQNFPRIYLLAIKGLEQAFGFETKVLRFLPLLFFLLATVLWQRLLYLRLRETPILLAVAVTLTLMPANLFLYSSMVKQYSFDLFVALIPFSLSDGFFRKTLRKGQGGWALVALALPCATSYTYSIALLGRLSGWYIGELRREGFRLDPRGLGFLLAGFLGFSALMWLTDFRDPTALPYLFWQECAFGQGWRTSLGLVENLSVGWYDWALTYHASAPVASFVRVAIQLLSALGLTSILVEVLKKSSLRGTSTASMSWGTRSLGSVGCIAGLLMASLLLQYPACTGRLTLFAFPCIQIVTLEGLRLAYRSTRRMPWGKAVAPTLVGILLISLLPAAMKNAITMASENVPQNIRTVLPHLQSRPSLPVLVGPGLQRQVQSLPEDLGLRPVWVLNTDSSLENQLPWNQRVLLLGDDRPSLNKSHSDLQDRVLDHAKRWKALHGKRSTVSLFLVDFPEEPLSASPAPTKR